MENFNNEIESFKQKSILVVCFAGTDRSRYISDELNSRGYFATAAGVSKNQNYVTKEDLENIGILVFSSPHEKAIFDKDKALKKVVDKNEIEIRMLCITESDKNRAHDTNSVGNLKEEIRRQLDSIGLTDLKH